MHLKYNEKKIQNCVTLDKIENKQKAFISERLNDSDQAPGGPRSLPNYWNYALFFTFKISTTSRFMLLPWTLRCLPPVGLYGGF